VFHYVEELQIISAILLFILAGFGAFSDILHRLIPNKIVLQILGVGVVMRVLFFLALPHFGAVDMIASMLGPMVLLVFLYSFGWSTGVVGAGDVKLWVACCYIIPPTETQQIGYIFAVGILGGLLSAFYIALRYRSMKQRFFRPFVKGTPWPLRIIRIEKWRSARSRRCLPYGVAIAAGAIVTPIFIPLTLHGLMGL
jgi:Flp pilus assembly protein protease CpaA